MPSRKENFLQNRKTNKKWDAILLSNPTLERGLIIAPVIVLGTNLKYGVAFSIAFFIITFFAVLLSFFIPKKVPGNVRAVFTALLAGGLYIPAVMALDFLFPGVAVNLSFFLPIICVNSLIVQKSGTRFRETKKTFAVADLFSHCFGFALIMCLVSAVRELLSAGTLWNIEITDMSNQVFVLPFVGFLLCGLIAAAIKRYSYSIGFLGEEEPESEEI
jgi:Na+-transporting NADH:ubiquinone oxidoreductase, subunit NqrD